ncbi:MAG: nucleotide sugar dehydrogenase [Patescibacteria group bacterium]|jgi:UDP-N-acetyl-D-glucosamine dehydrogenase|nr:nucleotide sugar dehydrogenase [Patescibacteria group bacterium]
MEKIAIIGLGYVGLPLAVRCAEKGYNVYGIDLEKDKIDKIKKGISPIEEDFIEERKVFLKKINATTSFTPIKKADISIICVPTPVDEQFFPILDIVESAATAVAKNCKKGQLVIVESTINPGVCEEVVEPIFANHGLKEGKDYFLAHCPERINPGDEKWNVANIARVVGSMSAKGTSTAKKFYESIVDATIKPMNSIREAEAVKIVENSFRDINLAFVNELAKSFDQMGINVKDVIDGASTKPFAFMPHYPGRGVGGHCIPVDPYYLIERAKKSGFDHHFLRVARQINNSMPNYTVEVLQDLLNEVKIQMKGTTVGILGLSYKANVNDLRESPSFKIIKELEKKKSKILKYDPHVLEQSDTKNINNFLKKCDALILSTNHKEFLEINPELFKKNKINDIVDGMNCLDYKKIKKLGIKYHGIGRK